MSRASAPSVHAKSWRDCCLEQPRCSFDAIFNTPRRSFCFSSRSRFSSKPKRGLTTCPCFHYSSSTVTATIFDELHAVAFRYWLNPPVVSSHSPSSRIGLLCVSLPGFINARSESKASCKDRIRTSLTVVVSGSADFFCFRVPVLSQYLRGVWRWQSA